MSNYQLNPSTVSLYSEKIMLKAMFEHRLFSEFFRNDNYRRDDVAFAMGLPEEMEKEKELKPLARDLLKARYRAIVSQNDLPELWQVAYENLAKLAQFLDLNPCEQAVMQFAFHFRAERNLRNLLEYFPHMDLNQTALVLSDLLGISHKEVKSVLGKQSKLNSYGLIERGYNPEQFREYLGWGDALDFDDFGILPITEQSLIERATVPTIPPILQLSDYEYIAKSREMMLNYLEVATKNAKKGVNILLYGAAGTGKTEFAALLANTLNLPAYTMANQDKDGDVLSGKTRLENCRLAQKLLVGKGAVIIFDEVEDVFASSFTERSVAQEHKAWVNDFLENNAIPMIWISNSVSCIDNAYLRRFDMIFEMPIYRQRY